MTEAAAPHKSAPQNAQKHAFQAETKQLLQLMIHSLYSNKEIFLRELVSNASDACDKLRFLSISQPALLGNDGELRVEIQADKAAGTLTLRDNGIGMSQQDLLENLGTIARSGTKNFMQNLSGDQQKDSQLIGQFGVGFYSAFIVADKVSVTSLQAGSEQAHRWESTGDGEFTLEEAFKVSRGTEIVLHLKADESEFLEDYRLESLVKKYSDHISLPVVLISEKEVEAEEGKEKTGEIEIERKTINQAQAFWTRAKNELTAEDYQGFYKHFSHDYQDALAWAHHKVEGNLEYTSLLYIPKNAPFDLWDRDQQRGVKLYVKRVFIMDKAAELLPSYLRFVRGVVDTADLPLNVSREILQGNKVVEKIKAALVKRVLDSLDDLAANQPEAFAEFIKTFGTVLKEGIIEDKTNQERIAKLLRFTSNQQDSTGLVDYVSRMKEGQKAIYYLTADTLAAAQSSPHLEAFAKSGTEVILLTERIDEWLVSHLTSFDGKDLESAASADIDLPSLETPERAQQEGQFAEAFARAKTVLDGRVSDVKLSQRLSESAACLVADGMSLRLERILKASGQGMMMGGMGSKPVLELNGDHPLVKRLSSTPEAAFGDLVEVLYDQAVLAESGALENPTAFIKRLNALIGA
jgi:molecular chaperone HtpG